jgi:hypothetical protein
MNKEGRHRPMGRQVPGASADAAGTHSAATLIIGQHRFDSPDVLTI